MLIYDCEIKKAITLKGQPKIEGIEYCEGWRDFQNMGISCIGAYDYRADRYRVFCEDNFADFQVLVNSHDVIIGFNSIAFDNQLCAANGLIVSEEKSYDLLVEAWKAAGRGPMFEYPSHIGFGLDAFCRLAFGHEKSGKGEFAPVDWQRGRIGTVIDYCLNDVKMTKMFFDHIDRTGSIVDPRGGKDAPLFFEKKAFLRFDRE